MTIWHMFTILRYSSLGAITPQPPGTRRAMTYLKMRPRPSPGLLWHSCTHHLAAALGIHPNNYPQPYHPLWILTPWSILGLNNSNTSLSSGNEADNHARQSGNLRPASSFTLSVGVSTHTTAAPYCHYKYNRRLCGAEPNWSN